MGRVLAEQGSHALAVRAYLRATQIPEDPWGQPYVYDPQGGTVQAFLIYSAGADMQEGTADDLTNEPSLAEE